MKSVTIKDPKTGEKLIKIFHRNGEYFVERLQTVAPFDCLIVTETNERIMIPARKR